MLRHARNPVPSAVRLAILPVVVAFGAACSAPARQSEDDTRAIRDLLDTWVATFNAQDLAGLRPYYPPDAVFMPPNAPPIVGPERILNDWFAPMFSAYTTEISLDQQEVRADRNWGFVRGTYVVRVAPKAGGDGAEEKGSFLDVVSRDAGGTWKIARAIWHSDTP